MSPHLSMRSIFSNDEETARLKKDDDRKSTKMGRRRQWAPAPRAPSKRLVHRIVLFGLALVLVTYLFRKLEPMPIRDRRHPVYMHPDPTWQGRPEEPLIVQKPGTPAQKEDAISYESEEVSNDNVRTYNGPPRFVKLASTLYEISETRGSATANQNILFAAASPRSASSLLQMACQMGRERRNYVHFALMGRSEISLASLRALNGVDDTCNILFHDARPDLVAISTDARLAHCAGRALYHIQNYMHPQAIIIDGSSEQTIFLDAWRKQASSLRITLIELPEVSVGSLDWITKLDSSSLAAWSKVSIDILINVMPGTSASLMRLLKSLSNADFSACAVPHVTIELPHDIDPSTAKFLETFQWPPAHVNNPSNIRQLSLRHRMLRSRLTEEESSIRFLESYWPSDRLNSHVLVLSPQAELSSRFFHYLKFMLLEYTQSGPALRQEWESRILGISLDVPSIHPNGADRFEPPRKEDARSFSPEGLGHGPTPFLWQAPNSNAVLFLGSKWVELHSFVANMIELERQGQSNAAFLAQKMVSRRHPAWLEHTLRLCRARGYWTIYPSQFTAYNLVTVHKELWQPPEESSALEYDVDVTEGTEVSRLTGPLLNSLLDGGALPSFGDMPLLFWNGTVATLEDLDMAAGQYTGEFRQAVGGCEDLTAAELVPQLSTNDLFCLRDY